MPHRTHKHKSAQHHHVQHAHHHTRAKIRSSAALIMAITIGLLAFVIAAVSSGFVLSWTAGATMIGTVAGGLIGQNIDRAARRKSGSH